MNAHDLIHAVTQDRWRQNFVLPTYTPPGWWECDVFEVTSSGYWREYEVKVTRNDFWKDAKKCKDRWEEIPEAERRYSWERTRVVRNINKHELLAARTAEGPSGFWYVTPAGLLAVAEVPEWAGLIEVTDRGPAHARRWRFKCREVKKGPRLHRLKCPQKVSTHARGLCYWRMHEALGSVEAVERMGDYVI